MGSAASGAISVSLAASWRNYSIHCANVYVLCRTVPEITGCPSPWPCMESGDDATALVDGMKKMSMSDHKPPMTANRSLVRHVTLEQEPLRPSLGSSAGSPDLVNHLPGYSPRKPPASRAKTEYPHSVTSTPCVIPGLGISSFGSAMHTRDIVETYVHPSWYLLVAGRRH
jgi:hypothetical protein